MTTYTVHRGDTLSKIANRFHTTVSRLAKTNHIRNVNVISVGQRLQVDGFAAKTPTKTTHTTKSTGTRASTSTNASAKMKRLAAAAHRVAMSMGGYRSQGLCATGVSRALYSALGIRVRGNGNQIDNNLPRSRFRQLHISLAQALKIPGLVLTWEHTSTRLGRIYGHTAITAGDGHTSSSDFIERNTLLGGRSRTGLKIFMPV